MQALIEDTPSPAMPRRLVITKAGSPSVLDVIDMEMPTPECWRSLHRSALCRHKLRRYADETRTVPTKATVPIYSRLRSKWNYSFLRRRSHWS